MLRRSNFRRTCFQTATEDSNLQIDDQYETNSAESTEDKFDTPVIDYWMYEENRDGYSRPGRTDIYSAARTTVLSPPLPAVPCVPKQAATSVGDQSTTSSSNRRRSALYLERLKEEEEIERRYLVRMNELQKKAAMIARSYRSDQSDKAQEWMCGQSSVSEEINASVGDGMSDVEVYCPVEETKVSGGSAIRVHSMVIPVARGTSEAEVEVEVISPEAVDEGGLADDEGKVIRAHSVTLPVATVDVPPKVEVFVTSTVAGDDASPGAEVMEVNSAPLQIDGEYDQPETTSAESSKDNFDPRVMDDPWGDRIEQKCECSYRCRAGVPCAPWRDETRPRRSTKISLRDQYARELQELKERFLAKKESVERRYELLKAAAVAAALRKSSDRSNRTSSEQSLAQDRNSAEVITVNVCEGVEMPDTGADCPVEKKEGTGGSAIRAHSMAIPVTRGTPEAVVQVGVFSPDAEDVGGPVDGDQIVSASDDDWAIWKQSSARPVARVELDDSLLEAEVGNADDLGGRVHSTSSPAADAEVDVASKVESGFDGELASREQSMASRVVRRGVPMEVDIGSRAADLSVRLHSAPTPIVVEPPPIVLKVLQTLVEEAAVNCSDRRPLTICEGNKMLISSVSVDDLLKEVNVHHMGEQALAEKVREFGEPSNLNRLRDADIRREMKECEQQVAVDQREKMRGLADWQAELRRLRGKHLVWDGLQSLETANKESVDDELPLVPQLDMDWSTDEVLLFGVNLVRLLNELKRDGRRGDGTVQMTSKKIHPKIRWTGVINSRNGISYSRAMVRVFDEKHSATMRCMVDENQLGRPPKVDWYLEADGFLFVLSIQDEMTMRLGGAMLHITMELYDPKWLVRTVVVQWQISVLGIWRVDVKRDDILPSKVFDRGRQWHGFVRMLGDKTVLRCSACTYLRIMERNINGVNDLEKGLVGLEVLLREVKINVDEGVMDRLAGGLRNHKKTTSSQWISAEGLSVLHPTMAVRREDGDPGTYFRRHKGECCDVLIHLNPAPWVDSDRSDSWVFTNIKNEFDG